MEHRTLPESRLSMPQRRRLLTSAAILSVAGLLGLALFCRPSTRRDVKGAATGSPYANTRRSVNYVGDASCVRCHAEIAKTYGQHPMGRSLSPIADAASVGADPGPEQVQFHVNGLSYSVKHQGNQVIHQETRQDPSGRVIAKVEANVAYTIGSGRQAFSYLIERDGFLFESPITWYAKDKRWGLSPGYDAREARFERPILSDCLFCHANRVEQVSDAINRYRTPVFQGYAIGCERCHGPGELHVRRPELVDGEDLTIVNPAKLEPSLRDAVCEQCHLIGPKRVSRLGTKSEDFRPGLPFQRFWSTFVPASSDNENRFASHAEQMHSSRCFRASNGRLGCISCHDPHVQPPPAEKEAFFRNRCLECHDVRPCSLAADVRIKRKGSDDCIGCHMPRSESSNNTHVATTNHRVPRHERKSPEISVVAETISNGRSDLVHFHRDLMTDRELALTQRDRGIALCRAGKRRSRGRVATTRGCCRRATRRPTLARIAGRDAGTIGTARGGIRRVHEGSIARADPPNRTRRCSLSRLQGKPSQGFSRPLETRDRCQPLAIGLPRPARRRSTPASRLVPRRRRLPRGPAFESDAGPR